MEKNFCFIHVFTKKAWPILIVKHELIYWKQEISKLIGYAKNWTKERQGLIFNITEQITVSCALPQNKLSFQLHHAVHNKSKKPLGLFWRFRPSTSNYNDTLYYNL